MPNNENPNLSKSASKFFGTKSKKPAKKKTFTQTLTPEERAFLKQRVRSVKEREAKKKEAAKKIAALRAKAGKRAGKLRGKLDVRAPSKEQLVLGGISLFKKGRKTVRKQLKKRKRGKKKVWNKFMLKRIKEWGFKPHSLVH